APILAGPLQIIGESLSPSRKPTDITERLGSTWIGRIPSSLTLGLSDSSPKIVGIVGPWISQSRSPTLCPRRANPAARFAAIVLFPTPPSPLIIIILRLMRLRLTTIFGSSGFLDK